MTALLHVQQESRKSEVLQHAIIEKRSSEKKKKDNGLTPSRSGWAGLNEGEWRVSSSL
jgi:hypothetical protein